MGLDPIAHLDDHSPTPFDAIIATDQCITIARAAYVVLLERLTYDAVRDDCEASYNDGMAHLWAAREAFAASVEE